MHLLKECFSSTLHLPKGFIFDIETTGLSPKYNQVVMISYAYEEDDQWVLEQHMAEDPRDELMLLLHFFQMSKQFLYCLHYNGDSFDIPFINRRLSHHSMDFVYPKERGFDLYQHFKKNKVQGSLRLQDQEKRIGFYRKDRLRGSDWVKLYSVYVEEKALSQREKLFLHNKEDVLATLYLTEKTPSFQKIIHDRLYQNHLLIKAFPGKDEIRLKFHGDTTIYYDLPGQSHGPLLFSEKILDPNLSSQEKKEALLAYGDKIFFRHLKIELQRRGVDLNH